MTGIDTRLGGTGSSLGGGTGVAGSEFTLSQVPFDPKELGLVNPNGSQPTSKPNGGRVETVSAPGGLPRAVVLDLGGLATTPAARAALVILARDLGLKNVEGKVPQNVSDNLAVVVPTSGLVAKSFAVQLAHGFRQSQHELDQRVLAAFLDKAPQIKDLYRETLRVSGGLDAANEMGNLALSAAGVVRNATPKPGPSGGGQRALPGGPASRVDLSQAGKPAIDMVPGPNGSLVPQFGTRPGGATGGALATRPDPGGGQTLTNPATGTQTKRSGPPLLPPPGGSQSTGQQPVGTMPSWTGPSGKPAGTTAAGGSGSRPVTQLDANRRQVLVDTKDGPVPIIVSRLPDGTFGGQQGSGPMVSVTGPAGKPTTFDQATTAALRMYEDGRIPRGPSGQAGGSGTSSGTSAGTRINTSDPFGLNSFGTSTPGPRPTGTSSVPIHGLSFDPSKPANPFPNTTTKDANDLLPQPGLGPQTTATGALPGNGALGFNNDLVERQETLEKALPTFAGERPTMYGSRQEAIDAAMAYNRLSPGAVALPLNLAFTDGQGRPLEGWVVHRNVPPGKTDDLLAYYQKAPSFTVLNANPLADAGLSPQGLAAREKNAPQSLAEIERQATAQSTPQGAAQGAVPADPLTAPQAPSANVAKTALALADTLDRLGIDRADLARAREQGSALTPDQAKELHAAATAYVDAHNADPLALRSGPTPDFLAAKAALEGYARAKGAQGQADLGAALEALGARHEIRTLSAQGPDGVTPQAGNAVPPSSDLAKLQADVTSAFPPGDIRFEQDDRLSRNGAVVLTLDPDGSLVVRHNGDIDPNLVESLKVIAEMGGKDYVAQGLRLTGTPKEITQRLSEWFREVAFLQNSGNEAAALIVEGPQDARLLPALALSPRAVVNPEEIFRVVDVPESGFVKKLHVWHIHPTGAIEHMPSGVNVHGLISQAALSAGDLNWAEDMLHILSGRWVPAQGSDLAGKFPKLGLVGMTSYDPLTDTITEQPIEFQPTGSAEWRDLTVYPGTPGNKVADVVTLSTQAMRVTPSEGVIPMEPGTLAFMFEQANTFREPNPDGSTQPSLREVLQQIATSAAFGNPLPPLGGPDGAVLTLSQLGAKFRTAAWYVWPGLDRVPNPESTLVYLKVPQMTVSAQTATGEVTIPAAFPVNAPTDDQTRILAAGTGDTPAQAQAYWEVLRELITPGRKTTTSPDTTLSAQSAATMQGREAATVSVTVSDIRSQVPQAWTIWKGLDQLTGDARVRLNPDTLDLTAGDRTLTPSRAPTEASAADRAALKAGLGDAPNQTAAFWAAVRRRLNAGSP